MQMLYQNLWHPDAAPGWPARPHGILEAVWVILMGFVSYASDGLMVGTTSWAHVIDVYNGFEVVTPEAAVRFTNMLT